jgi:alkylhydroperoxidase family enzyme
MSATALTPRRWPGCRRCWRRRAPRPDPAARPRELRPLARILAGVAGRVTGTGPPNIFTTLGQHPRLFRAWLWYSAHLMPFGQLPRSDTELVILRVAWRCRSAYEWHQHVPPRCAWIDARPDRGRSRRDAGPRVHGASAALLPPEPAGDRARTTPLSTWRAVQATLGDRETLELCLLIGNYQGLASTLGGLGIQVEPGVALLKAS